MPAVTTRLKNSEPMAAMDISRSKRIAMYTMVSTTNTTSASSALCVTSPPQVSLISAVEMALILGCPLESFGLKASKRAFCNLSV